MDEQLSDILQECLERLEAGASLEECLAVYPQHRVMLEAPLRAMLQVRDYPWPAMPPLTRAAIETRLLNELAAYQANLSTTTTAVQSVHARPTGLIDRLLQAIGYRGQVRHPWRQLVGIALGLILALVLGTMALAAARAIINTIAPPTTPSPISTPVRTGSASIVTLTGSIQQIASNSWMVGSMLILIDTQTSITGVPQIGAQTTVSGLLQADGIILAHTLMILPSMTVVPSLLPTDALSQTASTDIPTVMLPLAPRVTDGPVPTSMTPSSGASVVPTVVPTQLSPTAPSTATILPSPSATNSPTATATELPSPSATVTLFPTATSIPTGIATATQTSTPLPLPTAVPIQPAPTDSATPTQLASTATPSVPTDSFEALRVLITAGIADGRAEREGGQFLLEKLGEAQGAAHAGKLDQLRDRLRDMQQKTREQIREGKMNPTFGQQVLDSITTIASSYGMTISD